MKLKLFIYTIADRKVSKTYGGSNYTINVYEVKDNDVKFVTSKKACTRAHKGEVSEAFGALIVERPEIKKMLVRNAKKVLKDDPRNYEAQSLMGDIENSGGYYYRHFERFGLRLRGI